MTESTPTKKSLLKRCFTISADDMLLLSKEAQRISQETGTNVSISFALRSLIKKATNK